MSLGKPDLYIGGQLMQTDAADPTPALAGLRISWGTDSRLDFDPASTLSGQLLIKGDLPAYLDVGAPVGLIDPVSARTLFAGNLMPLGAAPDEQIRGAYRVSFTAASPLAELVKHTVLDQDWDNNTPAATRFNTLATTMPRGWALTGKQGLDWIHQGRQVYQSIQWITLMERFCRSYTERYHDTSYYVPGSGLWKRLTLTDDRGKVFFATGPAPGERGVWSSSVYATGSSGTAFLPTGAVRKAIEWEKTPEDIVTDVQISSFPAVVAEGQESTDFEYPMSVYVNNDALQDAYGFRQVKIETALSSYNGTALAERIPQIVNFWLDTQTAWRPTELQLPDSRKLDAAPLLNLLAVDTRPMATVNVPDAAGGPGRIRSFVMAGKATWTGKKWTTDLTLGRTL